ncbi:MAG: AEC family transporter [Anaerovoracaceae bacterium]
MNNLALAFSVVCPLFLLMVLGYFLRRIGMFQEDFLRQLNKVCFGVFLPTLLFINVYDSDFSTAFNPKLVIFAMSSIVVMFFVLMLLMSKLEKDNLRRGVMVQGIFRSNYILFGMPMTVSLFGADKVGTAAILIAFVVPLFNLFAVIALEYFQGDKVNIKRIFVGVVTNPLIIGALAAFVFVLSGIRLPILIEGTIRDISKIATPLALIILGGSFTFSKLGPNIKNVAVAVSGRLIFVPLCFLTLAIVIGYRGVELGALLAMLASPTAVSSFTMAQQMEADDELAGQIVVMSSLFSILTIFGWIFTLSQFGLL